MYNLQMLLEGFGKDLCSLPIESNSGLSDSRCPMFTRAFYYRPVIF